MIKIGVFGGSFNPIHIGHLILANDVLEYYKLNKIIFVPAYDPPLKNTRELIPYKFRYKMVEAAIASYPAFEISGIEKTLPKPSFTINTLNAMIKSYPKASLHLIIGSDQSEQFDKWKDKNKIFRISKVIVIARNNKIIANDNMLEYTSRRIDISSTEIRHRIRIGLTYRQFLSEAVYKIIENEKLYR